MIPMGPAGPDGEPPVERIFMKRRLKSFFAVRPASITVILTLLVLILFLVGVPILDIVELKTYDLRFLSRDRKRPHPKSSLR